MNVDGELYHLVGRYAFALVLRVGQACVGQVERMVKLSLCHGGIGWIDDDGTSVHGLEDAVCFQPVGFLLDVAYILCLLPPVGEAFLV